MCLNYPELSLEYYLKLKLVLKIMNRCLLSIVAIWNDLESYLSNKSISIKTTKLFQV